jgi:hypothetical protein
MCIAARSGGSGLTVSQVNYTPQNVVDLHWQGVGVQRPPKHVRRRRGITMRCTCWQKTCRSSDAQCHRCFVHKFTIKTNRQFLRQRTDRRGGENDPNLYLTVYILNELLGGKRVIARTLKSNDIVEVSRNAL